MSFLRMFYSKGVHNYKIKLFSILSALFFWFYVAIDNPYTHITGVPLRLINKPEGFMLLSPIPTSVQVEFRGTGKAFFSYAFRDRRIELNLNQLSRSGWMPLSFEMIKDIPPGMELRPLRIAGPDSIYVEFDRSAVRKIPLVPDITVLPRDGFVPVGEVTLSPDSVTVTGPRSIVDGLTHVQTKKLEFKETDSEISGKVSLILERPEALHYSEKIVRYKIDVQRLGEREMDGIQVQLLNLPEGGRVNVVPSTLSVKLQGGVDVLSRLKSGDISAMVDYNQRHGLTGSQYPALIRLPANVTLFDVQPRIFELIHEK